MEVSQFGNFIIRSKIFEVISVIPNNKFTNVQFAVLTVSDTRTADTDKSGQTIMEIVKSHNHRIADYKIVKDEFDLIVDALKTWCGASSEIQAIIITGGTGFTPRDVTYEAVTSVIEKEMTGFGELFRHLSFEEIGTRAMFSRATAGSLNYRAIYALPGSTNAVKLGTEKVILPSVSHFLEELIRVK